MSTALAILAVFALCLILTDIRVTRTRNNRAIENMRRQRDGL